MRFKLEPLICAAFALAISCGSLAAAVDSESDAMAKATAANKAKDYATSMTIYRKLADAGSAAAPAMIGILYFAGAGVPRDNTKACDFFAISEKKGTPMVRNYSPTAISRAKVDPKTTHSRPTCTKWPPLAASRLPIALGNQFLHGLGVQKDEAKAAALCRKSADRGVADAQTDLGQMYLMGQGVQKNLAEAAGWFQKAADQGNANAAFLLGTMYWNGDGVERDHEQAGTRWYQSALHGNASAPARLAKYYFARSLTPDKHIVVDVASKTAYWATLAAQTDPNPSIKTDSQKLVDLLLNAAPTLKPKVETMLAASTPPSF